MFGPIASLSPSGISVHAWEISFHKQTTDGVWLLQQLASSKKAIRTEKERKGKQMQDMKKRKETENGKTPGSPQPVV